VVEVGTAREMLDAALAALPADIAVFDAAVADWHVPGAGGAKLKKDPSGVPPAIALAENPDILATVSKLPAGRRPRLVIGFAAETDAVVANAEAKLARKGADWIVANDVSPATGIMGGPENAVTLVTPEGAEPWPRLSKEETAERLVDRIAAALA
jgi:phosphopantothenoylcysteine decarboxylase/phosphopantothenate--cysteine ligase